VTSSQRRRFRPRIARKHTDEKAVEPLFAARRPPAGAGRRHDPPDVSDPDATRLIARIERDAREMRARVDFSDLDQPIIGSSPRPF
jgi:hypothetical protein